jgi:hypothetical protein
VKIVWDEPKRLANIDTHRIDFAVFDETFFLHAIVNAAKKDRLKAVGWLDGSPVAVIFKLLGSEAISIVSARPASRAERRLLDG